MKLILILIAIVGLTQCTKKSGPSSEEVKKLIETATYTQLWETSQSFAQPKSVIFDTQKNLYYVSNIGGDGTKKDSQGWISTVDTSGKVLIAKWSDKFNAPKGMHLSQKTLWVTDIDEVVAIDTDSANIIKKIKVPGAKFLNDVLVSSTGNTYVTDVLADTIFEITKDKPKALIKNISAPVDLVEKDQKIYFTTWGKNINPDFSTKELGEVYSFDPKTSKPTAVFHKSLGNLDGIAFDKDGAIIVSDWKSGKILSVLHSGEIKTLAQDMANPSDFAWDAENRTLVIPLTMQNKVIAIKLK